MSDDLVSVVRCQSGDIDAFDELVLKYQRRVVNLAYHVLGNQEEAKEVALESFLRVYYSIKKFKKEAAFYTWLYRIVVNRCLKQLKGWQREREDLWEDLLGNKLESIPEIKVLPEEEKPSLKVLDALSDEEKVVGILGMANSLSEKEIGEILKCSEKKIQVVLGRIKGIIGIADVPPLWPEMDVPSDFFALVHKKVVEEGLAPGRFRWSAFEFSKSKISLQGGIILVVLFILLISEWIFKATERPSPIKEKALAPISEKAPAVVKKNAVTQKAPLQLNEIPEISAPLRVKSVLPAKILSPAKKAGKIASPSIKYKAAISPFVKREVALPEEQETVQNSVPLTPYELGDFIVKLVDPLEDYYIRLENLTLAMDEQKYPSLLEELDRNRNKIKGIISEFIGGMKIYEVDSQSAIEQEIVSVVNQRLSEGKISKASMKMIVSNKKGW